MPTARLDDVVEVLPSQPTDPVRSAISSIAPHFGVPAEDIEAIAKQESGMNQSAVSPKGAIGVMQLMPSTARELGVDPTKLQQNIEGGVRYYRQLLDKYGGDKEKALAAYNAGPAAVDQYGGVPPYRETQSYVKSVMSRGGGAPPSVTSTQQTDTPPTTKIGAQAAGEAQRTLVPLKFDESVGSRTFSYLQMMAGLPQTGVKMSQPQNIRVVTSDPASIGQRAVAVYISGAPYPQLNGYWTTEGKKLSNDDIYEEAGVGAGGGASGTWTWHEVTTPEGKPAFVKFHSGTGETSVVEGYSPLDRGDANAIYGKNLATGEKGWFVKGGLKSEQGTSVLVNQSGQRIMPLLTPEERTRMENEAYAASQSKYQALEEQYQSWTQSLNRQMIAYPATTPDAKAWYEKSKRELDEYLKNRKREIDVDYWTRIDAIRAAADGVEVTPENSMAYRKRLQYGLVPWTQEQVNDLVQPSREAPRAAVSKK